MLKMLIIGIHAFTAMILSSSIAIAGEREQQCLDVSAGKSSLFRGRLEHAVLPGPPGFEDVRKGDRPLSVYRLFLERPVCVWSAGDEFLDNVTIDRIHLVFEDRATPAKAAQMLNGLHVSIVGSNGYGGHNGYHKAPLVLDVDSLTAMAVPSVPGLNPEAKTTVEAFYQALAVGDGQSASSMIVPWKRSGPFAEGALTGYYGRLSEPLKLIEVRPLTQLTFEVFYTFVDGQKRCNGRARVSTTRVSDLNLIESIRSLSGC